MMKRRDFITLLGGAAVSWSSAARAQQSAIPVIGSLNAMSAAQWADRMDGFRRGLAEAGFIEGRNVVIESRWADGHLDRMPAMAADLIERKVAVIFVGGSTTSTRTVITATRTIPIVFTAGTDPVASGLVASLSQPGGNATGVTVLSTELGQKRVQYLREVMPTATKIALLVNPTNPAASQVDIETVQAASNRLGLELIILNGASDSEIEQAFSAAVRQQAAALLEGSDALFGNRREMIAALSLRHAMPTFSWDRESVASGLLMSYGPNQADMYRQAGIYVGRILKGEKPADLPVLQPTKFELAINLKTAKALGIEVPATLIAIADELIE